MPRVYKTSVVSKQRHKPFKGAKKNADKGGNKPMGGVLRAKIIKKPDIKKAKKHLSISEKVKLRKQNKQLRDIEKKLSVNSYLDSQSKSKISTFIKKEVGIKIIVLIPFNEFANTSQVKNLIKNYIDSKSQSQEQQNQKIYDQCTLNYPYFHFFAHPKTFPGLVKENFLFIQADRNMQNIVDYCKVADIICPILSCKGTNVQGLALDPYQNAKAFDQYGYTLLNILKHQGMPKIISLIQHLEYFENPKQHEKVSKLFKRYFTSQFGQEQKVLPISNKQDEIFNLLRCLQNSTPAILQWRDKRSYLLAEQAKYNLETKSLQISGFLKGNCVNANQLVHLTGFDDFEIEKIQIIKSKSKLERFKEKKNKTTSVITEQDQNLVQYSTQNDELFPFHRVSNENEANELMNAFEGLTLSKPILQQKQQQEMQEEIEGQQEQVSYQGDDINEDFLNFKEEEKKNRMELHMRGEEDLEFEDEVEYPPNILLRERYIKYQGLASFKKTEWNSLENLPDEFNKIYVFKNYQKTMRNALQENEEKGFAYPGFYIKITIKNFNQQQLSKLNVQTPLIVSFLFKHQRKMTMLHLKVKRNPQDANDEQYLESKKPYEINFGFRRIFTKPIFSQLFNNCQKTKYKKKFKDYQNYYYCSFYYYNTFPPANVTIYQIDDLGKRSPIPNLYGELAKADPMHIILKRIILTGYPLKINRRRATVRYMFFNPKDVKYFKPIQLITKLGLRGNIEESLGTHGYMKCLFSDMVKPHDTICLYLYKRVFPIATF